MQEWKRSAGKIGFDPLRQWKVKVSYYSAKWGFVSEKRLEGQERGVAPTSLVADPEVTRTGLIGIKVSRYFT